MFQLEISGNDIREEQSKKNFVIYSTLCVFHLEISGIDFNFLHPLKKNAY